MYSAKSEQDEYYSAEFAASQRYGYFQESWSFRKFLKALSGYAGIFGIRSYILKNRILCYENFKKFGETSNIFCQVRTFIFQLETRETLESPCLEALQPELHLESNHLTRDCNLSPHT